MKLAVFASLCYVCVGLLQVDQSSMNESITVMESCAAEDIAWQAEVPAPVAHKTCGWLWCRGSGTCCNSAPAYACVCKRGWAPSSGRNCYEMPNDQVRGSPEWSQREASERQAHATIAAIHGLEPKDFESSQVDEILEAVINGPLQDEAVAVKITRVKYFNSAGTEIHLTNADEPYPDLSYAMLQAESSYVGPDKATVVTDTKITAELLLSASAKGETKLGAGELYEFFAQAKFGVKAGAKGQVDINGISASISMLITADVQAVFPGFLGIGASASASAGASVDFAAKIDWVTGDMQFGGEAFAGAKTEAKISLRWVVFKASARAGAGATAKAGIKDGVASAEVGATLGVGGTVGFEVCFGQIYGDVHSIVSKLVSVTSHTENPQYKKVSQGKKIQMCYDLLKQLPNVDDLTTAQAAGVHEALTKQPTVKINEALQQLKK